MRDLRIEPAATGCKKQQTGLYGVSWKRHMISSGLGLLWGDDYPFCGQSVHTICSIYNIHTRGPRSKIFCCGYFDH